MQKFNSTGIFTGYIKQLLHDFNLPKIKVYKQEYQDYFEKYGKEHPEVLETIIPTTDDNILASEYPSNLRYIPYIKNNEIQEYINGKWVPIGLKSHVKFKHLHSYDYGNKLLNYTKNLRLNNNIYDSYTHEYLGDFLRFKRDYLGINLMPLYNCFSNRSCDKLDLNWKLRDKADSKTDTFSFSTADTGYKIYMLPVKLFQKYTIAIDSTKPVELCCGIYGDYQDTRKRFEILPQMTYYSVSQCNFSQPFIYDKLLQENVAEFLDTTSEMELIQNESDLKLFIKLPQNNNSTIVVLEGDYVGWNDTNYFKQQPKVFNIDFWGEKSPDEQLSPVTPTAENQYYLDTKNYYLYKSVKSRLISGSDENNWEYRWIYDKYLWQDLTTSEVDAKDLSDDTLFTKLKNHNLHIDNMNYELTDSEDQLIKSYVTLQIQCFFKRYKINHPTSSNNYLKLTKQSAYFNTKLKQVLINPLEMWIRWINHRIINIDSLTNKLDICLSSPLQLLQLNTQQQIPFANRLIEYLLENATTNDQDEIVENIKRVQKGVSSNTASNNYTAQYLGIWDFKLNKVIYEYITTRHNTFDVNHDILGYMDKDVEKYYKCSTTYFDPITRKYKTVDTNLLNIELATEDK